MEGRVRRIWLVKPKRAYRKWRKPDGRPVPPLKEGIRCKRCREIIPVPPTMPPFICKGCLCGNPLAIAVGTRAPGHYEDDPSGASSSWDNIVKAYEDSR